jgi:hypothetical protein
MLLYRNEVASRMNEDVVAESFQTRGNGRISLTSDLNRLI